MDEAPPTGVPAETSYREPARPRFVQVDVLRTSMLGEVLGKQVRERLTAER